MRLPWVGTGTPVIGGGSGPVIHRGRVLFHFLPLSPTRRAFIGREPPDVNPNGDGIRWQDKRLQAFLHMGEIQLDRPSQALEGGTSQTTLSIFHSRRRDGRRLREDGRTRNPVHREPACKPGSVVDSHSSGTCVAACLERPTREPCGPHDRSPIWSCSGWGLPCRPCCHGRGALLPHPFTLACAGGTPAIGGLLSVALSVGSHRPGVTWHPALRSPDFPPPTGGPRGSGCPADSRCIAKDTRSSVGSDHFHRHISSLERVLTRLRPTSAVPARVRTDGCGAGR